MEKKVIITLSRTFQNGHSRSGEPTLFKEHLLGGKKLHTIRENYDLWKHNVEKVVNGDFILSVREWSGRPYNSPQYEIKRFKDGVGCQPITMRYNHSNDTVTVKVGNHFVEINELAKNDCLPVDDFKEWFFGSHPTGDMMFHGIVIQFTPFRY